MPSPLKRGERVIYKSSGGEISGQVTEDEVNGKVKLDIRSRQVAATSVKRQRLEEGAAAAARPVARPVTAASGGGAPEAGPPPSEGGPVAAAARPVAPAAIASPEPAGAAGPGAAQGAQGAAAASPEALQPGAATASLETLQPKEEPQDPADPGQSSRVAPRGADRQPGEPDEAVASAIVTWMGGLRNCRGLVDHLQAAYPDKKAAADLRTLMVHTFSKKARAGVSWSNFDAAPKSAVNGHIHPAHLNYTLAVAQDMVPYVEDVARAIREIITHGVGDVVLHVRATAFPPLAAANYEHPAAFLWGPDDSYQSYVHFFAILAVVHFVVAGGLPVDATLPPWLLEQLGAVSAKFTPSSGPMERCSKVVRRSMYNAATNREFDDFMMFHMVVENGWRTEEEVSRFVKKHNASVSYDKALQLPPHSAKRIVMMARGSDEWREVCVAAVGQAGSMAKAGLRKEILSNAETYPGHCFTKSTHALFHALCTTSEESTMAVTRELIARHGRFDGITADAHALACKAVGFWWRVKEGPLKRLGVPADAMETTYAKVLAGKYDADVVNFARDFDEDTSETDIAAFDKYLQETMTMVADCVRLGTPTTPASPAACPGAPPVDLNNEEWWTERFEFEVKKYLVWRNHRDTSAEDAKKAEAAFDLAKRKHASEATKKYADLYTEMLPFGADLDFVSSSAAWREKRMGDIAAIEKCSADNVLVCVVHNFTSYQTCTDGILESGRKIGNAIAGANGMALYVQTHYPTKVVRPGSAKPLVPASPRRPEETGDKGGDPEESGDDAGTFPEFPGLPTSASKSECYKDGGERKALMARDFRRLQELGDGVDGRHGEPSTICFEEEASRRGPPLARPPTRVLCVIPSKNSPWMLLSGIRTGRWVAAPPRLVVTTNNKAAIQARRYVIETTEPRAAAKHDRYQLGDDFWTKLFDELAGVADDVEKEDKNKHPVLLAVTAVWEGTAVVQHAQWISHRLAAACPGNKVYLSARDAKENFYLVTKTRRELEYARLFDEGKLVVEGKKQLEPPAELKKLREASDEAKLKPSQYEILKVGTDGVCHVPDLAAVPFKASEKFAARLSEVRSDLVGSRAKKQRVAARPDLFPKTIDGIDVDGGALPLPAGLTEIGSWSLEVRADATRTVSVRVASVRRSTGETATYVVNAGGDRISFPARAIFARSVDIVLIDKDNKEPDAARPSWDFIIDESTLVEYLGCVDEFCNQVVKAREETHVGPALKLYNHNLSFQAVRGSVHKYKVKPHPLPSPRVAFQLAPGGAEVAGAFSLADCGYDSDVVLVAGWSLKPHGDFLIPTKECVMFWAFAGPVVLNPGQWLHLRQ